MAEHLISSTWIELNRSAFFNNSQQYKKAINDGFLAAVVKSNAYGHGQAEIARLCQEDTNIDWLCVATLSDAIQLRQQGISKPILVISHIDANLMYAARYDIDVICYEKEMLDYANMISAQCGKNLRIHIKVDTGVSRFGLFPDDVLPFIHYAQTLPFIHINGIFTHFAQSQQEDQTFTLEQYKKFCALLEALATYAIHIPFRHCSNSAATTVVPSHHCNLFRVGAGLYGMWPSESVKQRTLIRFPTFSLQQILSWKSTILALRNIPAGTPVGYDSTFITKRATRIALAPVGYYEGYDRRLSNRGHVLLRDMLAPVIGRVCMNIIIIDVTDIPTACKGDDILLIGDYPGLRTTDIAEQMQSFNPREVTSQLNAIIPRIILDTAQTALLNASQQQKAFVALSSL